MGIGGENIGTIDHVDVGPRIMRANLIGYLKNPTQNETLNSEKFTAGMRVMHHGTETRTKQVAMGMKCNSTDSSRQKPGGGEE